jgi:hypothetical protein
MRIAVLIYGRLNKCVNHYSNILDALGREHQVDFFASSDDAMSPLLEAFLQTYKPIAYTNDKIVYTCNFHTYVGKHPETNIHNMTCHFINKERVFLLLEAYAEKEHIEYDAVVSLRVDVVFQTRFQFAHIDANTVYIPVNYDYTGINDQIAYGTREIMKKYSSVFQTGLLLLEAKKTIPHPETLTLAVLRHHNVEISRVGILYILDK